MPRRRVHHLLMTTSTRPEPLTYGSYLHLDAADEDEILEALRRHGWTCTRDDVLVSKASGY